MLRKSTRCSGGRFVVLAAATANPLTRWRLAGRGRMAWRNGAAAAARIGRAWWRSCFSTGHQQKYDSSLSTTYHLADSRHH